jgi:hypothetical protein
MDDRLPLPHILTVIIQPMLNFSLGYELPSSDVCVMSALHPRAEGKPIAVITLRHLA